MSLVINEKNEQTTITSEQGRHRTWNSPKSHHSFNLIVYVIGDVS